MTDKLVYQVNDGVATMTLNRPAVLNAFDLDMTRALQEALKNAERDAAVRCLVLTGAGKGFSAGQDLSALYDAQQSNTKGLILEHIHQTFNPIVSKLRAIEKPIIAAINGAVAGAGLGVALACDLRFASDNARFFEGFVKIGLAPDSGVGWTLPKLVGMARAMEFAFTGEPIDALTAERWGLVNRVYPADRLMDETLTFAKKLAQGPTRAIGMTKRVLNRSLDMSLEELLEYEALVQEAAGQTADHREGVKAFLEKRAAQFTGQ
jgi:2-(1,2-epoxy-1,2-dihydrophenyl)acetyl-CoA isomerase